MPQVNLLEMCKESAEMVPNTMPGPDGNWMPVLLYEDGEGRYHTVGIPALAPDNLQHVADALCHMLKKAGAVQASLVLPTYFTNIREPGSKPVERVLVTYVDKIDTTCESAKVIRSANEKPRLGRWDIYVRDSDVGTGVFVDAMRAAIG